MGIQDEALWRTLEHAAQEEDAALPQEQKIGHLYLAGVQTVAAYGLDRAKTIRDAFPMYTLHDERHICNVLRLMAELLGEEIHRLTRDEAALLVLCACCHDIGMSCAESERAQLLEDRDRIDRYLDTRHSEYVKAYARGGDEPVMSEDMIQNYLRSIHHERCEELLCRLEWPAVLESRVPRDELIRICRSHGEDASALETLDPVSGRDLRFCAILLRLADILDFDTSRAPHAVYDYCGFDQKSDPAALVSREEWRKHMASQGFDFQHVPERAYPYELDYNATSRSMQIEQAINAYLDWVDRELSECGKLLARFAGEWQRFVLPAKIKRQIRPEGYMSGQYRLTLDQDRILELLVGRDLYSDPAVFVRELIQNAIDAVRTRQQLDKDLPCTWQPQIHIRCWMDEQGYHWFRIEDNGTGMTEDIIQNFLLKIGRSYYNSDTFQQEKLRCRADPDYMPISRFGIGILSCFMGNEQTNRVEISTKRFTEHRNYPPALRLSMHGMSGYYYMASSAKNHTPGPMKGVTPEEQAPYLRQAGTVVAVRTNLYQSGKYRGFKEIVDRYVVYPPVKIHYDGAEGSFDYPTGEEFMRAVHSIQPSEEREKCGLLEFPLSQEQLQQIYEKAPELSFAQPPKLALRCTALDRYTQSPYLSGALVTADAVGRHPPVELRFGNRAATANVHISLRVDDHAHMLNLHISLDLPRDFEKEMEVLQERYGHGPIIREWHALLHSFDPLTKEIAEALSRGDTGCSNWRDEMQARYSLSTDELKNACAQVKKHFQKNGVFSELTPEDLQCIYEFQNRKTFWTFPVLRLLELPWYRTYFHSILQKTGLRSLAVHNGILCGGADFFCSSRTSDSMFGAILLFKDRYRPSVDIARDAIRRLPLETDCDLSLISEQFHRAGWRIYNSDGEMEPVEYAYLPAEAYWQVLQRRDDFCSHLRFSVAERSLSEPELRQQLRQEGKLALSDLPPLRTRKQHRSIFLSSRQAGREELYRQLCMAYLRKHYSLRVAFQPHRYQSFQNICVVDEKNELPAGYGELFPALMFLPPLDPACPYLTVESSAIRYACNAKHRFSQFLLKNGPQLKRYMPGILRELLRILAEESDDNLISDINGMMAHLRNFPGGLIDIPADLSLTQADLF